MKVPGISPDVPVDPVAVGASYPPRSGSINGFLHSLTCRREKAPPRRRRDQWFFRPSSHKVAASNENQHDDRNPVDET